MHPFGGTPICPRCSKAVYAAEQVMGPGRRLFHKPCLACMICNKRLDSFTLLEHNQEPYCKTCHVKNFGTKDLRQANLPHRPTSDLSAVSPSPLPPTFKKTSTQVSGSNPIASSFPSDTPTTLMTYNGDTHHTDDDDTQPTPTELESEKRDTFDISLPAPASATPLTSLYAGQSPQTSPLGFRRTHVSSHSLDSRPLQSTCTPTLERSNSSATTSAMDRSRAAVRPLSQTATGTRYGAALGGSLSPTKQWVTPANNPSCPRCGKAVYFAEQVKAVGKTFHKGCLRCTECSALLDSSRLTEREGQPFCHRCYNKLHGPQGGGYALLGKAGG